VKLFQIFERFMNVSSTEENPCKDSKECISVSKNNCRGRKIFPVNGFEVGNQFRGDEESVEKEKEF
jgi:hypothetical protein